MTEGQAARAARLDSTALAKGSVIRSTTGTCGSADATATRAKESSMPTDPSSPETTRTPTPPEPSAESLAKAHAISQIACQHLTSWMCCPVCVALALEEVVSQVQRQLDSAREELADWPRRYDDSVQFLQHRCSAYIADSEEAKAPLRALETAVESLTKERDAIRKLYNGVHDNLLRANLALEAARAEATKAADLLEFAWGVIANAGSGDWKKETDEWQEAAVRFRERWHELIGASAKPQASVMPHRYRNAYGDGGPCDQPNQAGTENCGKLPLEHP